MYHGYIPVIYHLYITNPNFMYTEFSGNPSIKITKHQNYVHQDLRSSPPPKKKRVPSIYSMTSGCIKQTQHHRAFLSWLVVKPTHLKNMLLKLDHLPKDRDENNKYLSCHHPVYVIYSPFQYQRTNPASMLVSSIRVFVAKC